MKHPKKLPSLAVLISGLVIFFAPTTVLAGYESVPASFYDWGSYYQPKVLGFSAYAQEPITQPGLPAGVEIPKPTYLLPDSPFYFTKSFIEGVQTFTSFGQIDKQNKYLDLAQERLAETYALADKGKIDLALDSADRYRQQVETVSQNIQRLASQGVNVDDLASTVEKEGVAAELVAQASFADASPASAEVFRQVLSGGQNLVDTASQIQKEPVISDDLSASIQNLKNQGLLTLEQSDKLYQLESRGEVRGELEKLVDEGLFPKAEMVTLDQAVGESYPNEYQRSYETAKFMELRNFVPSARPDEETAKRLSEFKTNYKAGEPIPGEIKPYLYFLRSEELARTINLDLLPDSAEVELRNFYPESINANQTATNLPAVPGTTGEAPDESPLSTDVSPSAPATANQTESSQATPAASVSPAPTETENFATPSASLYIGEHQGLRPDSRFRFLETIREGLGLITTFDSEERLRLKMQYAEERLREAESLLGVGKDDLGLEYLEKYISQIRDVGEQIDKLDENKSSVKVLAGRLEEEVARHNILFEKAIIPIPAGGQDELQKAIVATQDLQDIALDLEGRAAIPAVLVERLQDLKNSGILLPEEVSKITEADSRQEVRQIFRDLEQKGTLPPADSKKLDSAQWDFYPDEFNKLVEVRKIEELVRLRSVQNEIGKTQQLRTTAQTYDSRIEQLESEINPIYLKGIVVNGNSELSKRVAQFADDAAVYNIEIPDSDPLLPSVAFALPTSRFYFLKSWGENLAERTAFGYEARERVRLARAQERLSEANALVDAGNEAGAQEAIEKYQLELKTVVDGLGDQKIPSEERANIAEVVEQQAARDNLALAQLSLETSTHTDGTISTALDLTRNALDKSADARGEPAIPDEVINKINNLPDEMLPDDKKQEVLEVSTRSDGRAKIENLVTTGLLLPEDYQYYNQPLEEYDPVWFARGENLLRVDEIISSEGAQQQLTETANKNEEIAKKLAEFQENFKPGDSVPEDIRPYVPLTRIDELARTIRPDIVNLSDFARRSDVVLAIAALREEFKPTIDDYKRLEEYRRQQPSSLLPPDLARIEALSYALGVRTSATSCYLPSPPFPQGSFCPPPGAPLAVIPTVVYNLASAQVSQVYGVGPQAFTTGNCPDGFHWMSDSGGWCMSNSGAYTPTGSINSNSGSSYTYYPPGSANYSYTGSRPVDSFYDSARGAGSTSTNFQYTQYAQGTTPYTPPYSPYTTNSGESSYGRGPQPVSPGNCPDGFHWMSDSGGWCMSNGITYTPTPAPAAVSPSTNNGYGGAPNYYNSGYGAPYNPSAPNYWGPAPTNYSTFTPPGSSYGTGPAPVSPGVCPAGFHWMFDSGGWCMSDGGTYTPASPGSPYPANTSGAAGYYACSAGYYWNGASCAPPTGSSGYSQGSCPNNYYWTGSGCTQYYGQANSTNSSGGCNSGFYWNGFGCVSNSTYSTYCGSGSYWNGYSCVASGSYGSSSGSCSTGYYWNGSSCVSSSSSGSYSSGSTSSGSCPTGYHWMSDSGGWCMADGGGSSSSSSPTSSTSPSTTSGSCPSGSHWMSDNGGYCMSDGGSSSPPPSTSSEPAPAPTSEPAPQPSP